MFLIHGLDCQIVFAITVLSCWPEGCAVVPLERETKAVTMMKKLRLYRLTL